MNLKIIYILCTTKFLEEALQNISIIKSKELI